MCTDTAPVRSAFSLTGISSSPCPRSAQYATTSQRYVSMSQRRMTEVSRPPEYARTTRLTSGIVGGASEQVEDHRLLGVQTVFRLIEHDRLGAIEHLVGDLLAAVRGQTVHDDGARLGEADDRVVELVTAERLLPLHLLCLLAHRRPHVGVEHVGAVRRAPGIFG